MRLSILDNGDRRRTKPSLTVTSAMSNAAPMPRDSRVPTYVARLRDEARVRAMKRPRFPAMTTADLDATSAGRARMRRYSADPGQDARWVAVFAHGGYFVLGDLDLQDGYCRRLAKATAAEVFSVDYALAPEHTGDTAVNDFIAAVTTARSLAPHARVLLCGDSAGGAIAYLATARLVSQGSPPDAVFLTNPNLDLSMALFDRDADGGPDPELLAYGINAWAGESPSTRDLDPLSTPTESMPPLLIAVGELDALRTEAHAVVESLRADGRQADLNVLRGVGHGFMSNDSAPSSTSRDVSLRQLRTLLGSLEPKFPPARR